MRPREMSRRRDNLTFAIHAEVASLVTHRPKGKRGGNGSNQYAKAEAANPDNIMDCSGRRPKYGNSRAYIEDRLARDFPLRRVYIVYIAPESGINTINTSFGGYEQFSYPPHPSDWFCGAVESAKHGIFLCRFEAFDRMLTKTISRPSRLPATKKRTHHASPPARKAIWTTPEPCFRSVRSRGNLEDFPSSQPAGGK